MSGGEEKPKPVMSWNLDIEPGDEVKLFRVPYIFERVDPDDVVTFRPPSDRKGGDFMIETVDGQMRKPTTSEVGLIWAEGNLQFIEAALGTAARRFARQQKKDISQAKAEDEEAPFKVALLRLFDNSSFTKSDNSINLFMKAALAIPEIAAMEGAREVAPTTFRRWLRERGTKGARKVWDCVDMTGRMPRTWTIPHPIEIVMYWAIRATHVRGDIQKNYDRYVADIYKINNGKPLNRNFCVDPSGEDDPCERPAEYPVPAKPYKAISYKRFWRMCRALKSTGYKAKTSAHGAYQLFGGGGESELATHLGAFCWMDDTPIPRIYFFDEETGINIGQCTLTLMIEALSRVIVGWHLNIGAASSSSVLNAVLHANRPKHAVVTDEILEIDPHSVWFRLKPGIIGFDNSTANHGRAVEDVLTDGYMGTFFAGSDMPRDKSYIERLIGTVIDLAVKQDPDANYDIARMRRYKFNAMTGGDDTDERELIPMSFQRGLRMIDQAVMTYNVSRHKGLDKRQPGLVWAQKLQGRKLDKLEDEEGFAGEIGDVDFEMEMTSSGIDRFSRHYTPGAVDMTRIIKEFNDGVRRAKDDIGFDRRPNTDDRKKHTHRVKGKYSREDIGLIKVWNPYHEPPQWEHFHCTDPSVHGMPLWLHERCLELAKQEALEYCTPEQQSYVRARLFEQWADVNEKSAARERQAIAKAVHDPAVKKHFAKYVEVRDEDPPEPVEVGPEPRTSVEHGSAVGKRLDAHIPTPRQKSKPPKKVAELKRTDDPPIMIPPEMPAGETVRRRGRPPKVKSQQASQDQAAPDASGGQAPELKPLPTYISRRDKRLGRTNAAPRDAGTHHQSADRPDQRGSSGPRSMKWGDDI